MTVREPEWTEQDRAEALALLSLEAETCSGCGEPKAESMHADAEGGYKVDDPTRCHACTELNAARDKREDGRSLFYEVERIWTPNLK